ncbi:MAG: type I-E CRISPR-associated protein Cas6/Cse3/CasE [Bacteroidetes bacterium]|nr:type I-E CRISPR-associated protein Cas6/Cse3/CasE [Bacteroidota bacterium]
MTDTSATTLHMVQLALDPRRLAQLGKMLHLPLARTRTHYLVHCALGELFQDQAPKPFSIESGSKRVYEHQKHRPDARAVRVLGYADVPDATLHELAKGFASPAVYRVCDWDALASKPMPETFPEGMRLRFELQACPVIRKASADTVETKHGTRSWKKGEEVDAFLDAAWSNPEGPKPDRETVYREWLARQLDHRGGARLDEGSVAMQRFSIERMTRRGHGPERKIKRFQAPDVTLTGTLTVTDSDAFLDLLRRGIGRQKSFGYGMLKVRRA